MAKTPDQGGKGHGAPADDSAGTRDFTTLLKGIDEGRLSAELDDEMREVLKKLHEHAFNFGKAGGELTLKIKVAMDDAGMTMIMGEVKTKVPQPKRGRSVYWVTRGFALSADNPAQMKLPGGQPLRDVSGPPASEAREPVAAAGGDAPAREV